MPHVPVLAGPALEYLRVREDGVYVDCTAGAGGHTERIAERLGPGGRVVAIDRDPRAVALARERVSRFPQATVLQGNYGELGALVGSLGFASVDGVLIDAGLSSMQLDDPSRGFTFQQEGPLDMRMDPTTGQTAAEYLATVDQEELTRILKAYGDVPRARAIARAICQRRTSAPLATTSDLADVVAGVFDFVKGTPEETRTVFQAIRIAVNDELRALERGIEAAVSLLNSGGRLVCIAFHSGEDRIVKNTMRRHARAQKELHPDGRVKRTVPPILRILTKRPVQPSAEEIRENPRAHSARLRVAERL